MHYIAVAFIFILFFILYKVLTYKVPPCAGGHDWKVITDAVKNTPHITSGRDKVPLVFSECSRCGKKKVEAHYLNGKKEPYDWDTVMAHLKLKEGDK